MIKKEYTIGDLTVIWEPARCIHAGVCFRSLPEVFRPRERPWIQLDKAEKDKIIATVKACPSAAISIKTSPPPPMLFIESVSGEQGKVNIITNGPAKMLGPCVIKMPDGSVIEKPNGVSLCRCGASATKPFCDGSHKRIGFTG